MQGCAGSCNVVGCEADLLVRQHARDVHHAGLCEVVQCGGVGCEADLPVGDRAEVADPFR